MDYDYDSADILGSNEVPIVRDGRPRWPSAVKLVGAGATLLLCVFAYAHARKTYKKWQEKNYRKAMRRRHGIPDSDHRAFNVAYAAAVQARQAKEVEAARQATARPVPPVEATPMRPSPGANSEMRQRVPNMAIRDALENANNADHRSDFGQRSRSRPSLPSRFYQPTERQPLGDIAQNTSGVAPPRHSEATTNGIPYPKMSRGAKRASRADNESEVDEEEEEYRRVTADKRARKHSLQKTDVDMDIGDTSMRTVIPEEEEEAGQDEREGDMSAEAQDELMDLVDSPEMWRGKKRDRAEAGSTIGIEDEEESERRGSVRRRKRRAMRRLDATSFGILPPSSARGKKRDLSSDEDDDTTMGSGERSRATSKRRSRRAESEAGDVKMDFGDAPSVDPLCGGRRIGEEWELHGTKFKVGPNGQRLRQELVRRVRPRFVMPKDSVHPDANEDVEYFTEVWMSEEEYLAAKDRGELFWQRKPGGTQTISSLADAPPSFPPATKAPTASKKVGKELLWESTTANTPTKLRIDPLQAAKSLIAPPSPASRRIGSSQSFNGFSGSALGSPRKGGLRAYSKWEKQDQEAEAMARMRLRLADERAATSPVKAGAEAKTETGTPKPLGPAATAPPTFNLTPPTPTTEGAKAAAGVAAPISIGATKPKSDAAKVSEQPPPPFKLPSLGEPAGSNTSKAPTTAGFTLGPTSTPTPAPTAEKPASNFSFGSTPTTASTTTPAPAPAAAQTATKPPSAPSMFSFNPTSAPTTTAAAAPVAEKKVPGPLTGFSPGPQASAPVAAASAPAATAATNSTPVAAPAPTLKFSFGSPPKASPPAPPTAAAPAVVATPPAETKPPALFSFGGAPAPTAMSEKKDQAAAGTSIFNRVAPVPTAEAPKPAAAAPAPASFSFGAKPTGESGAPQPAASPFGTPAPSTTVTPGTEAPKFNFGTKTEAPKSSFAFGTPTAGGAVSSGSTAASSAPTNATTTFGFGTSALAGAGSTTAGTGAPAATSAFGTTTGGAFGTSAAPSAGAFGSTAPKTNSGFGGVTGPTPAAAPTPGGFGSTTFGSAGANKPAGFGAPSAFGSGTATAPTAGAAAPSAFSFGAKPGETAAAKPAAGFGGFGAAPTTSTTSAGTASKPPMTFNFGATTPGAGSAPAAGFGFGSGGATGGNTTPAPVFGGAGKPADGASATPPVAPTFSFGTGSGNFTFGKK